MKYRGSQRKKQEQHYCLCVIAGAGALLSCAWVICRNFQFFSSIFSEGFVIMQEEKENTVFHVWTAGTPPIMLNFYYFFKEGVYPCYLFCYFFWLIASQ